MSVLPLSLFLRVEGGASRWVLRRGSLPSGKSRGRVTLWSGSWGEAPSGFLGHSHKPPRESAQLRSSLSALKLCKQSSPPANVYQTCYITKLFSFLICRQWRVFHDSCHPFQSFSSKSFTLPSRARIIHPLGLFLSLLFP